jgi:D-aminopeptidase
VQCNCCSRRDLSIAGVPVGLEITDLLACTASSDPTMGRGNGRRCDAGGPPNDAEMDKADGSIIIVIATNAPLLPGQLKRVATRASLAVGRMGGKGENGSGDIFLAFSTANPKSAYGRDTTRVLMLSNERVSALFTATVQATEEAIVNAMLGAETMTGANDRRVYALPVDRLRTAMAKYGRPIK